VSDTQRIGDLDLLGRVRNLFLRDGDTAAAQLHPDFVRYFKNMFEEPADFDLYVDEVRYLAKVGRFRGQVLDLAAGFGLTAICLRALGVANVSCVDLVEVKVSTARRFAELVKADGCTFQLGDASGIPFADSCFDGVLIKDAASHFQNPAQVYAEVCRVLKPGGRFVLFDDRNALNHQVRLDTRALWERSETGTAAEVASIGMAVSFTQMRQEYILRRFPAIQPDIANAIANQTRGYTFALIDQIVPSFLAGKKTDIQPVAQCINPQNGIVQERLIDPILLTKELSKLGVDASVQPPPIWDPEIWRRRSGDGKGVWVRRFVRMIWPTQKAWPILVKRMGQFVVAGVKRSAAV
jgi:ubiquinone/menaquinone biosynthesis C-methylase UbiE